MLVRSRRDDWRVQRSGWGPCIRPSTRRLRRERGKRNDDHQGRDRPIPTIHQGLALNVFISLGGEQRRKQRQPSKGRADGGALTMPTWRSTVAILLFAPGLRSLLLMIFSTAKTTPSLHRMPIAVPPFSTAFTAYSTYDGRSQSAG